MIEFSLWDIVRNLLLAARWTVALALMAFVGGGVLGLLLLMARVAGLRVNATPSMPRGLWRVTVAETPLRRGQIVTVCLPDTPAIRKAARRGYIPAGTCPGGYEPW